MYRDLIIVGAAIGDNRAVELERGLVRAFDARTGALRWTWDPIPTQPADPRQPRVGRACSARAPAPRTSGGVMSVDPARGLVFVPTSSASPDFYGGERVGTNRYANSLVALEAATGKVAWHQQLVHHDLWDYDVAAQPVLVDLVRDGRNVAAVVQATKMGLLFVFDRENGAPCSKSTSDPCRGRPSPGEQAWPTQPFPAQPPPLVSHAPVTPEDAWGLTFWDRGKCRELIGQYRSEGIYTPPSLEGTILYPSYVGGTNWGSLAFDSERQWAIVPTSQLPMVVTLLTTATVRPMAQLGRLPRIRVRVADGCALRHAP